MESYEHNFDLQDQLMEEEKLLIKPSKENIIDYGLSERKKHQKLTLQQKKLIKIEIVGLWINNSQFSIYHKNSEFWGVGV